MEIELPPTLKTIGQGTFYSNKAVTGNFTIQRSVETIGPLAFVQLAASHVGGTTSSTDTDRPPQQQELDNRRIGREQSRGNQPPKLAPLRYRPGRTRSARARPARLRIEPLGPSFSVRSVAEEVERRFMDFLVRMTDGQDEIAFGVGEWLHQNGHSAFIYVNAWRTTCLMFSIKFVGCHIPSCEVSLPQIFRALWAWYLKHRCTDRLRICSRHE